MAKFEFELIKVGREVKELEEVLALKNIIFEDSDDIVILPREYNGRKVTHYGYKQGVIKGHMRFHDWHHSSQGDGEYVEDEYVASSISYLSVPSDVKKIIIPNSADSICMSVFNDYYEEVILELEEGITGYKISNGKIKYNYSWL